MKYERLFSDLAKKEWQVFLGQKLADGMDDEFAFQAVGELMGYTITGLRLTPGLDSPKGERIEMPQKWSVGWDDDVPVHDQLAGFGDVPYRYGGEVPSVCSDPDPGRSDAATVGDVSPTLADQLKERCELITEERQKAYFRGESGRVPMNFAGFSGGWASKDPPLWLFKDFKK